VGELLLSREPYKLANQIKSMVQKRKNGFWDASLAKAADELCWENEEKSLLTIYKNLL